MKLLLLCILLIPSTLFSQFFFIGYSEKTIWFEIISSDDNEALKGHRVTDTSRCLTWYNKSSDFNVAVYFDNDISYMTIIFPMSTESLNSTINEFNKYVIINDKSWKVYIDDRTFKIGLHYTKDLGSHFIITEI